MLMRKDARPFAKNSDLTAVIIDSSTTDKILSSSPLKVGLSNRLSEG